MFKYRYIYIYDTAFVLMFSLFGNYLCSLKININLIWDWYAVAKLIAISISSIASFYVARVLKISEHDAGEEFDGYKKNAPEFATIYDNKVKNRRYQLLIATIVFFVTFFIFLFADTFAPLK